MPRQPAPQTASIVQHRIKLGDRETFEQSDQKAGQRSKHAKSATGRSRRAAKDQGEINIASLSFFLIAIALSIACAGLIVVKKLAATLSTQP